MTDSKPITKISRRDFLIGLGAGVVVTGAGATGLSVLSETFAETCEGCGAELPVTRWGATRICLAKWELCERRTATVFRHEQRVDA